jgi:hypothetical protein
MKILVSGIAPGTEQSIVKCTSDSDFLLYGVTNGDGDYVINVKSTGFGMGTGSPTFVVGGVAHDIVTLIVQPGTTGFITLQTEKSARASIVTT